MIDDEVFPDAMDRNGTGLRITFKFIPGRAQDFVSEQFGALDITRTFYAPYIFIDPPAQYSINWAEGDWSLALSKAKTRSSATSGMDALAFRFWSWSSTWLGNILRCGYGVDPL